MSKQFPSSPGQRDEAPPAPASGKQILVTGATGYIGGSVAVALVARGHRVRGLVRNEVSGAALEHLGVQPVFGSLDDVDTLGAEARSADVVVNAASSDHRRAVDVLLDVLAGTGKALIHTSGSSIVGTTSAGEATDEIWDESIMAPDSGWEPHPYKAARVAIDRRIIGAAGREVRGVVLCNSLIYGMGRGLKRDSVQIPALTSAAVRHRAVCHVGSGENRWSTVHVGDMTDLYVRAVENDDAEGFYFVESGEASYRSITRALAERMGLAEVRSLSVEAATEEWGYNTAAFSLGSNSRVRGHRAPAELGWHPVMPSVTDWIRVC